MRAMARHSVSSFNEADANRLLADFLEQKHSIKTFFKENDRTPNYDGSMELTDKEGYPIKQFIVQIKKVENLSPNVKGKNKGRYIYQLETAFLEYVKARVTDSPSIYFVVDIATKNIFWLYLSDELVNSLSFDGKDTIPYPFTASDIIQDIDSFVDALSQIVAARNELNSQKTPEEQDVELLRFYQQCFDRPAFQDDIRIECSMENFEQAMEDTLIALTTGVLKSRDGTVLKKADGKTTIHNQSWRETLDEVAEGIAAIKNRLDFAASKEAYYRHDNGEDVFYCFHDYRLAEWLNSKRDEILKKFSKICVEAGLPRMHFRCRRARW